MWCRCHAVMLSRCHAVTLSGEISFHGHCGPNKIHCDGVGLKILGWYLTFLKNLKISVTREYYTNYAYKAAKFEPQYLSWFVVSISGPIDNSDFLCRHGGVLPQKSAFVYDLCIAFPQPVWELLYSRFGGGPPCTRWGLSPFTCSRFWRKAIYFSCPKDNIVRRKTRPILAPGM